MLHTMGVGRRKLAPLWGLVLVLAYAQHTDQTQDGSSTSSYEYHRNPSLSTLRPGGDTLHGVTVFPPLRTTPVVRALNSTHNGRVCSTWGDFHYKTFDGDVFRFPGLCNYVFSAHCGAAYEDFNIQLRRSLASNATTPSRVTMKLDGMVVELTKSSVLVNGHLIQLPFSQSGVFIERSSSYLKVVARLGLVFMWNQDDSLLLELDSKYANKTCGLCGDFNGVPVLNEFLSHNTRLTPIEFGNLQKMDGPTEQCQDPVPEPLKNCSTSFDICKELLSSRSFSGCTDLVNVSSYLEACRQDFCFCERDGLTGCVCDTLAEYSRQCAHAGGLPQDWRSPDLCPQTCPHNMRYHECRSPCTDTCSNREHSQACEDHCVAGCFCPEGTVLDDISQAGCIHASQCSCTYNGATYAPGDVYSTDCTNCTCSGGQWSCEEVPCPGTCSVLGGAHFSTFDEKKYTVHGDCSYVLTKSCNSSAFTVLAELRRCGLTDNENCLKSLTLSLDGGHTVIVVKASGEVFVNQIYTQLPVSAANVTLFRPSTFFIIAQTTLGLQLDIQLVPTMQVFVRLMPELRGLTCGLCGNFNSIQADDLRTISGVVEGTAAAFANTWKTQASCPNVKSSFEDPCSLSVENEKYAQHWCSRLTDTDGPFTRCHTAVDPATYYSNCMFDTCNCEKSEDCLCAALSSYVHACAAKGVLLSGWRDGVCTKSVTTCPKSMTYHYHVNTCQPTCRALSEEDVTCQVSFVSVDGCTCPRGTFLDDAGKCVSATSCPCYYRGSVVPNGESVHDSGAVCTCTQGKLTCVGGTVPTSECAAPMVYFDCRNATSGDTGAGCQKSCHTLDMACYSSQCVSGCICPEGLVADDNGSCIAAEACPCVHNEASYQAGQSIRVGCNTCTCENRMWQCTEEPCLATCAVYGDGHYLTFDGQSYSFDGDCEYTLVQDHCGKNSSVKYAFRVVTENVPCGTTGTTCSKAIKIFLGSTELKLSDGKVEVIKQGSGQEVPYSIRHMGIYLVVDTEAGLVLLWDRRTSIFIRLSPELKGKVCGLCGNFDGNAVNDFTTRSQSVVGNALEFGNSWKLSPSCPDAQASKDPCTANPYRKSWAQKQCSIINSPVFATCHDHVEPTKYHEACVSDSCACDTGGDCECFCTAVAAYAQACHEVGVCVSWRTPDICPLFCDYYNPQGQCEWHYQPCGAPCMKTCQNPQGQCLHDIHGLEGCYPKCPPEAPIFDEDKMQCVPKCPPSPCQVHGKSYQPGTAVPSDKNCQSCVCTESGVQCTHDAEACVCTYDKQHFRRGDIIYHTTDGTGGCISARCGANGTIERNVSDCSSTTPVPPTTFAFSTILLGTSWTRAPSIGPGPTQSTAHPGPPSTVPAGISPRTTPAWVSASTSCGEECQWSAWLDVSHPGRGKHSGDYDTLENLRAHGYWVCQEPRAVECRAEDAPEVPLQVLGQHVECSPAVGLTCHNGDQASGLCHNYQIRVFCCNPLACHTSSGAAQTAPPTTSSTTETGATSTERQSTASPAPVTTTGPVPLSTPSTSSARVPSTPAPTISTSAKTTFSTPSPTPVPTTTSTAFPVSTTATGTSGAPSTSTSPQPSRNSCFQELCTWTEWIDGSYPGSDRNSGDFDTFKHLRAEGYKFCERPTSVQCRAERFPNTPLSELGQVVTCNAKVGLICLNKNQLPPICLNYEIRIQCCQTVDVCTEKPETTESTTLKTNTKMQATSAKESQPTSTEHTPTSSATVTRETRVTSHTGMISERTTRGCQPQCSWTRWFDVDVPSSGPDSGDNETYGNIIRSGEKICHRPEEISRLECRAETQPEVSIDKLGQVVKCDRDVGLVCRNRDQQGSPKMCLNYEVRVLCCKTPEGCPTTGSVTLPSTPTETITSQTQGTSSVPSASMTSTKMSSTPSAPTSSTTSPPTTRTTSPSTTITTSAPTISTPSAQTTRTTSPSTTSTYSAPTLSTSSAPTTRTTSPSTTSTSSAPTISTPYAQTTRTTSPATTSKTSAPTPSTTSSSTTSTSSTPVTTHSPVPITSTTSMSTSSTSNVPTPETTQYPSTTRGCQPQCSWTRWFDVDVPSSGPDSGDNETYGNIIRSGEKICHRPEEISRLECRAETQPEVSIDKLGQVVKCDRDVGLVCRNRDQQGSPKMCLNYEVRVLCCKTPEGCPTTGSVTLPSTPTETITSQTQGTSSVPSASMTSTKMSSTPSAPTSSTTSPPTTRTTSPSTTITTSAPTISTPSAQTTRTTSPSTTSTYSAPTISTPSAQTTRTTSPSTTSTSSAPTLSTSSAPTTRTTSPSTTITSSAPTISTPYAQTTRTTSPATTSKTSAPTPSTTSSSTTSTSSTPVTTHSPVPITSTTSMSTSSTSHVPTPETTQSPSTTRGCQPQCSWTRWFDVDVPSSGPDSGDNETYGNIIRSGEKICHRPEEISRLECRAETQPEVSIDKLGQVVKCDRDVGLVCRNRDQQGSPKMCLNYEVRVLCCKTPEGCPTTGSVTLPSTPTETITSQTQGTSSVPSASMTSTKMSSTPSAPTSSTTSPPTTRSTSPSTTITTSAPTISTPSAQTTRTTSPSTTSTSSAPTVSTPSAPTTRTTSPSTTSTFSAPTISTPYAQTTRTTSPATTSKTSAPTPSTTSSSTTSTSSTPVTTHSPFPITSITSMSTSSTSNVPTPETTQYPSTTRGCQPQCSWTRWFDVDVPSSGPDSGDNETYGNIIRSGEKICHRPEEISRLECRAETQPEVSIDKLGQVVKCDRDVGLVCRNRDQQGSPKMCLNYEVRVLCCKTPEGCPTTGSVTLPSTPTETITSQTQGTSSVPSASMTSTKMSSTPSAPTSSTTSPPTTRTTSPSTTITTSAPTISTPSAPTTRTTSPSTTSTFSAPTISTPYAQTTRTTSPATTSKTSAPTPSTTSSSTTSTSSTPVTTHSPVPITSTTSMSTSSTSNVPTPETTQSPSTTRGCQPQCSWTRWFDVDVPSSGPDSGDNETYGNIIRSGEKICHRPEEISRLECRAETQPEVSIDKLGQVVKCDRDVGLVCRNRDQQGSPKMCLNYEVRVLCCKTPEGCPTTGSVTLPSTPTETITSQTQGTSSVPSASMTSTKMSSTPSAPTSSTTSPPTTRTTSPSTTIKTSAPTISTPSAPTTRTTSPSTTSTFSAPTISTPSAQTTRTTSPSTTSTSSAPTVSTPSAPTTRTTSPSTTSTFSAPTISTPYAQTTRTTSPSTTSTSSAPTLSTSSAQTTRTTSPATTSKTSAPTPSTTSSSTTSTSSTPVTTHSPVPITSTTSMSTSSTSNVPTPETTQSPSMTRGCQPQCSWTRWFDVDVPSSGPDSGDNETYGNIIRSGEKICHRPEEISRLECRAETQPEVSIDKLGQVVKCDRDVGLVCRNRDQQGSPKMCLNYEVRVLCCKTPEGCPTTGSVTLPSTPTETITSQTQGTSSVPSASMTSTKMSSTPSAPTSSTTSPPTTRSTSPSTTITTSAPTISTPSAQTTRTTSPSTTSTSSAPTVSTPSAPTTRTTSPSTTSTFSAPTISTPYAQTTRTTSPATTSTSSAPTLSTSSAQTTRTTSPATTSKTSAPTPSTTSSSTTITTSAPTVSTPSAQTTRTTSPSTTSTSSAPTLSTSSAPTTRSTSPSTTSTSSAPTISTPYAQTTRTTSPATTSKTSAPTPSTTSSSTTSTSSTPVTTHSPVPITSTTSMSTSSTSNVPTPETTQSPSTTRGCQPQCSWTRWFDVDVPSSGPDSGDNETYGNIIRSGEKICHQPKEISRLECRAETQPEVSIDKLGQVVKCDRDVGLVCRNRDQQGSPKMCLNYEVRVLCCKTPEGCPTTGSVTLPSTPTETITSQTQGTSSVPSASMTSTKMSSTPSAPTSSTTSPPTTRSTSPSTTITTSAPTISTPSAQTTRTTSPSTTSTYSAPTVSTPSAQTTRTTSPSTTSTSSAPTLSTSSAPTTRTTSPSTTSTFSAPTISTPYAQTTRTTSPATTSKTSAPTPSTTSSSTTSTSSTPVTTHSPVPITSTTSMSTSSTSHVPTPETTQYPSTTRGCQPQCSWTRWFDVDVPSSGPDSGDNETYGNIIRSGEKICHRPEEISRLECRAETQPEVSIDKLGQVVKCDRDVGLVCRNRDQQGSPKMCLNYEVRVLCCKTPEGCPLSSMIPYVTSPTKTSFLAPSSSVPWWPSSTASTHRICFCNVSGQLYPAGFVIYRQTDLTGHCYYALCNQDCQVIRRVDQDCPSTTPPPTPATTSVETSTSAPVTAGGCPNTIPPRKRGDTWDMPNCSQATCEGNNTITVRPRKCPQVKKPTCANGYPAVKVSSQDGCCQDYHCQCVCSGWGDPHYITFDGTYYTFLDNCTYVLVQQIVPVYGHFRVLVDNYFCDAEDGLSCPQSIIVEYQQDRVVLTRRPVNGVMTNQIIFNKKVVSPGFQKNGIDVSRIGIKMYVTIPHIGVQVMFTGLIFSVEVPFSKFTNNTEGQCGTCTNNKKDECRLPGGMVATSCSKMASHWRVPNPDQPYCLGTSPTPTTTGPTPVEPTTTPTTCPAAPICQLILSKVFEPCHAVIPPQPFYEGCVFDHCHMNDSAVVCSSLELYASLCTSYGVCIDWRDHTNRTCLFTCPADKVYQACGPSSTSYCYGNDSTSLLVLHEAGNLTEGCFCPDGETLFSTSINVCVPQDCSWCLGPHGKLVEPGHSINDGCQECTCEGGSQTTACRRKPCPLPPTCPLPGFVAVRAALLTNQCCPQYSCACNVSYCPKPADCPEGSHQVLTYEEGTCCPVQYCNWTACSVNGTLYQPGAVVSSSLCETCRCEVPGGAPLDAFTISCETQICNTHCPLGFKYQVQHEQCCGACVQVACVVNASGDPTHLFYPGETWSDPGESCVTYECEKEQDGLVVVTTKKACPALSCPRDQATLSEDGCCLSCPTPLPGSTCAVYYKQQIFQQGSCSSAQPMRLAYCQGNCGDTSSIYSLEANTLQHKCRCCQELRTSLRNVTLHCADGSSKAFSYTEVEECGCLGLQCHSEEPELEQSKEGQS